jgi:hypothetical protein
MRELAANPQRRARLVAGGVLTVAVYHPDIVGARLQRLYRDVVGRAAAVRR